MKTKLLRRLRRKAWRKIKVITEKGKDGTIKNFAYWRDRLGWNRLFIANYSAEEIHYEAMRLIVTWEVKRLKNKRRK